MIFTEWKRHELLLAGTWDKLPAGTLVLVIESVTIIGFYDLHIKELPTPLKGTGWAHVMQPGLRPDPLPRSGNSLGQTEFGNPFKAPVINWAWGWGKQEGPKGRPFLSPLRTAPFIFQWFRPSPTNWFLWHHQEESAVPGPLHEPVHSHWSDVAWQKKTSVKAPFLLITALPWVHAVLKMFQPHTWPWLGHRPIPIKLGLLYLPVLVILTAYSLLT